MICGESGWYETFAETPGELFRANMREYGRCTGKVYVDDAEGKAHPVGWVFQKRIEYQDAHRLSAGEKTYLQDTWVTYRKGEPEPHCSHCGTVHGSGRGISLINCH